MSHTAETSESLLDPAIETSRISAAFDRCKAENRAALMPFVTGGYPTLQGSSELIRTLAAAGADLIEIGVPFSDPMADGATVQHASQIALEQGVTLADCLAMARQARVDGVTIPILLMGYTNPFLQYGFTRLAQDAATAGVDGFIIPDLPLEESAEARQAFRATGRDLIFFVAPTSTDRRIADVASIATGFIYCVALTGVTGARTSLANDLPEYMARVRAHTDLPLAIGFGISSPAHVRQAAAVSDGVIVASALINLIDSVPPGEQAAAAGQFIREMAAAAVRQGTRLMANDEGKRGRER